MFQLVGHMLKQEISGEIVTHKCIVLFKSTQDQSNKEKTPENHVGPIAKGGFFHRLHFMPYSRRSEQQRLVSFILAAFRGLRKARMMHVCSFHVEFQTPW